ncbi:hypothetical protein CLAFUW4_13758 [Fulvia fulva]|uniref:Uncharacterized protein n=1 Tax=Passalora fulva TaxID=5499 RepID=A0A9Q8UVV6_PASFU|nr:uncharacterized protein CLAFUR5_13605 [Fulvia fulva]KAK4610725.1 hypothetical protein CLAFUR4_13761 [Fulvia fulva]KAK4610799.1 hypothetical protein CLAFUR0_13765 [Fulvia fulva]UJO24325.1 hypothetical protein CLAFUR5_13605 [Fulvia fulva]WPV22131.1 hypothetical protein CLAFUW4_13758 [Fulvia fulva]WPV37262.1 hypothetical protein CLAFUW7_13766 [Fulvia fulva]
MLSADWDKDRPATTYMELFSCALDAAPEYCDDPRVEKVCRVKVDFKNANRKGFETKRKYGFFGKKSWLIDVELQCIFGSKTGGLHFKSLIAGAVSGTATAEFD